MGSFWISKRIALLRSVSVLNCIAVWASCAASVFCSVWSFILCCIVLLCNICISSDGDQLLFHCIVMYGVFCIGLLSIWFFCSFLWVCVVPMCIFHDRYMWLSCIAAHCIAFFYLVFLYLNAYGLIWLCIGSVLCCPVACLSAFWGCFWGALYCLLSCIVVLCNCLNCRLGLCGIVMRCILGGIGLFPIWVCVVLVGCELRILWSVFWLTAFCDRVVVWVKPGEIMFSKLTSRICLLYLLKIMAHCAGNVWSQSGKTYVYSWCPGNGMERWSCFYLVFLLRMSGLFVSFMPQRVWSENAQWGPTHRDEWRGQVIENWLVGYSTRSAS